MSRFRSFLSRWRFNSHSGRRCQGFAGWRRLPGAGIDRRSRRGVRWL